ncbi:PREDICTED: mucin-19 isoform X3 [Drosophila arizonae]|uniref:Mucin-19 isoform X3 n=1 Tax=Drosophila arizonae TaxID=7263 RepID=A0ABM1PWJ7_DROAR|nr:PREDICTED: mucin-19 isoform X3 [Drosophila arizonae]
MPLAKIKASSVSTRNSMDKEPSAGGSNASSKATSETQRSRDASPTTATGTATTAASTATSTGASTKKEKHQQRKQVEKGDEKRGKRKKDEITVEKIDTGDFVVGIGDKLKVNYHEKKSPSSHGSTYEAKVIEISVQRGVPMYLVHYTGWNNRYDEWVPRERIAENLTKGSKQKTRTISTSSANSGGAPAQAASTAGNSSNNNNGNSSNSGPNASLPPKDGSGKAEQQQQPPGPGTGPSASLLQGLTKTPTSSAALTTQSGSKRGRGRSDSMPPRSTTPSSVASNSSRTKSPAASQSLAQLKHKRPTRTLPMSSSSSSNNQGRRISASASISANVSDASMGSDSDTDSDEPVRRPKRLNAKDAQQQQQQSKAKAATASGKKVAPIRRTTGSDDSDDDDDEEQQQPTPSSSGKQQSQAAQQQQQQQQQATAIQRPRAGNRAMSSGGAGKGRDYDLSEIRSELKGFQPQLLERKEAIKSEPSDVQAKQEPKTGSSTEQSSETDSYMDEDSQSSEKLPYRKQQQQQQSTTSDKRKGAAATAAPSGSTADLDTPIKKESEKPHIKHETLTGEDRKPFKVEPKEEQAKPFHSGADIKPTTTTSIIAPARFGANSSSNSSGGGGGTAKCTSVIVEKPLTMIKKTEKSETTTASTATAAAGGAGAGAGTGATMSPGQKLELLKKLQAGGSLGLERGKKFAEPVQHKETATLKVELPAACSPSSSSSSSSSFCSSSNNSAATSASLSSSSATRSLPDMSKLEISSGTTTTTTTTAAAAATAAAGTGKESKYSNVGGGGGGAAAAGGAAGINNSNLTSGIKRLSSDVYEFKDTEPFEFEKRISPMACGTSVIASSSSSSSTPPAPAPVIVSAAARKQALKMIPIPRSIEHQLPHVGHEPATRGYAAGTAAAGGATAAGATAATSTPSKAKKRGSPLKEASLTALEKPKLIKVEQQQQQQATAAAQSSPAASPNSVKSSAASASGAGSKAQAGNAAGCNAAAAGTVAAGAQLTPGHPHATPFDVLRRSPSFNLNIVALNEELAQTVQETTRALNVALQPLPDALQLPATPPAATGAPAAGAGAGAASGSGSVSAAFTPVIAVPVSPKLSTPPQAMGVAKTTQQQQQIVGSPFMETRNVFELSTSNEGSGYSSGESNKDNKLEKLENVKILLAGSGAGSFDLDAVKYEQKPTSIADKVLKAISQKKEEVEQSKTKIQTESNTDKDEPPQQQPLPHPSSLKVEPNSISSTLKLDTLSLLSEPLKVQTGSGLPSVLSELYHRTSSSNSPETKSILDASLPAKNNELSETIQKLECAIQRKTPVAGQSLGSSLAGTPPVTAAVGTASFSDESMDSTDSEQRLVIEDVIAEEPNTATELKSPMSEGVGGLMGSAPVKLELAAAGSKPLTGVQAPIALKPVYMMGVPMSMNVFLNKEQSTVPPTTSPTPTGTTATAAGAGAAGATGAAAAAGAAATHTALPPVLSAPGVPVVVPEIPVSVVVALRHSPGSASPASPKPDAKQTPKQLLSATDEGGLLLKPYTAQASPPLPEAQAQAQAQTQAQAQSHSQAQSLAVEAKASPSPLPRPFALYQQAKELPMHVSPAAGSPLISEASHTEAAINLLCEETIPGSPAPNYSSKDEPTGNTLGLALGTGGAAVTSSSAVSSTLTIPGIAPLPPDTPSPRANQAALAGQSAPAASVSPNSSPESPASQDDSSEETGSSKKHAELESNSALSSRRKRRAKASESNVQSAVCHFLGKRRRQQINNMRKTAATTGNSWLRYG